MCECENEMKNDDFKNPIFDLPTTNRRLPTAIGQIFRSIK
jgi:hypothetical protein